MRLLRTTLLFLVISLFFSQMEAQQCAFDPIREQQLQDPNFIEQERIAEERIQNFLRNGVLSKMDNLLTIPIVVHVLHLGETEGTGSNISDAQIVSSLDNLNDFYRGQTTNSPIDFEIEFALAQRDPDCNATTGINRINASSLAGYSNFGVNVNNSNGADYSDIVSLISWPQTDYFNVWIVTELDNNGGGSGFQGYAYFYNDSGNHGSVMMHTVFGYDPSNANPSWPLNFARDNSTVVHEVGHYFHLYHTFQGDNGGVDCPADITVGVDSDGCADTVRHRRETSTCPANNSCTGNPWVDNNTINNIMSYYSCTDRLTNDQRTRARAIMEGTSIVSSKGADLVDPGYMPPSAVCLTNSTSTNNSGITSVELNGTSFSSFSSASDGGNIDNSANCSNYFEIDATTTNTLNVGMFAVNWQQIGVWIDWNDDGDFEDDAEQQYLANDIAEGSTVAITLTYPSTIPYGDYVRIRLITEVDDRYGGISLIDSSCYTGLVTGQSEDYTIYVQPQGDINYVYDNGWLPSDPDGVADIGDTITITDGNATISNNTNCDTLIISENAGLTIESGATLTANTITLNSTSSSFSSLILNGTIAGTVIYNRYVSAMVPVAANDLISAPLSGETFGDFVTDNSNLAGSGTTYLFGPYNTVLGGYQNYDSVTNSTDNLESGIGYRAATSDGSNLGFNGSVLSVDILDIPISDSVDGGAWNLLGNPYPSYLDFNAFFTANASEFDTDSAYQAVYGYDGTASNGWTIWNQATIDEGSVTELIAPGQGFFVKAKSGGGLIDFTTSMRSMGNSDDFIVGRPSNNNASLCKLNISKGSDETYTQIYFIDGTTRGLDSGYDASTYSGNGSGFSIYSNLVDENNGIAMAIQSLPYSDLNNISIPLGINATLGTQLRVSLDDISTLPENINVYLEDNQNNSYTLLNTSDYIFTPNTNLSGTGRFYVHFSSQLLSIEESDLQDLLIYTKSTPNRILIKGIVDASTVAELYDIQGRSILKSDLNVSTINNVIDTSSLVSGIYIIKISNGDFTKTQKLVID